MSQYKTPLVVLALVVINILGICLTTVNTVRYKATRYHYFTRQRFAWLVSAPPPKYPIQAGWATMTIPSESLDNERDWLQTNVLVLDNGTTLACLITVDLPIMPPQLAQELTLRLPTLGVEWKNTYLGISPSPPSKREYLSIGSLNKQQVHHLADAIMSMVDLAKKNKATTQLGYSQVELNGEQPAFAPRQSATEVLHFLQLRKLTGESALLCSGPALRGLLDTSIKQTAFTFLLLRKLAEQTNSFTMGLIGSIDTNPSEPIGHKLPPINQLVNQITTLLAGQTLHTDSTLIAQTAPLILNDPQVRISQNWRLKPWLARSLYGDYPAELKALRIGQTVFVGCPGELSAELGNDLRALPIAKHRRLITTSYNGGDIGQLVPDTYYYTQSSRYAVREFNRFGPHTAEFITDITQLLVNSLK